MEDALNNAERLKVDRGVGDTVHVLLAKVRKHQPISTASFYLPLYIELRQLRASPLMHVVTTYGRLSLSVT